MKFEIHRMAGKSEPLTVAALRFGIHAPSFPLISEMAFSLMAAMYDLRIREPGYVSDCSVGTDPSHFTRQIGDLMFSNARLLEDLIAKWDGVIDQMAAAEKYNQEFEESREYRKWLEDAKGAFDGCPRWGPISTIQQEETRRTYQSFGGKNDRKGLLKCDEKGTRKSREDRLLRYENLAAGSLSLEAVTRLMREVRSTSDAGQVFAQKRTECMSDAGDSDESECMTSVEALKVLEAKVTRKAIYRMCLNRGLQCDHEPKQKAKGPKSSMKAKACKICDTRVRQKFGKFCTQSSGVLMVDSRTSELVQEHDTQDMAMQVVASMGGGMIGNAGRNGRNKDAFGRCQSNSDCWLLNTKCEGDGDEKSCRCEVGSCFTLVQNPGNPHDGTDLLPVCQTEHGGWREMALNMKRSFLTYRYTLGQMVGKIDDTIRRLDDHLADVYHEVDCTRIALDPRFKNMEGSIGAVYYNFPHAGAAWVDLQPGQGHVTGFYETWEPPFVDWSGKSDIQQSNLESSNHSGSAIQLIAEDSHPIVNWRHENLMRLFFRNLRYFVKPRGLVKIASNMGAVGVRFSYIMGSAEQNEFQHVETLPFLEWSLHRYGRAYGDRRDKKKRPGDGQGYNAQKAESDMVYTFEHRPKIEEIKLPPTFQTIMGCNDGPFKNLDHNSSVALARQLHERFIKEVSGTHVG
eukprot:g19701.t1